MEVKIWKYLYSWISLNIKLNNICNMHSTVSYTHTHIHTHMYSKCTITCSYCSWLWNGKMNEVGLQYWITWKGDIERKNWGCREGLKWWALETVLDQMWKEESLLEYMKKSDVHKYILNMIHSCFMKISHIARSSSYLLFV